MRYAMTGASGFVGGVLARLLLARGHQVNALVRRPYRAQALAGAGVELVPGDLADDAALDELCADVDGLFHVAGWYHLGQRDRRVGERVNVDGTRSVLAAVRRAGTPKLVYTSTLAVNSDTRGAVVDESYRFTGRHISVYDATKARAHADVEAAAADGLPAVTVMPGLVYGPGDSSQTGELLRQTVAGHRPLAPAGGQVCWGHVEDIAAGHLLAMERGAVGESYMLAGPAASLAHGLSLIAELADTPGPSVLPTWLVRATATLTSAVGRVAPLPAAYHPETLRSSLATYLGRSDQAIEQLGWSCRSLRHGLGDLVDASRSEPLEER